MPNLNWHPIEDLPHNWLGLASAELESLSPIWQEQSRRLGQTSILREFNDRLQREWAIETGIIENLYAIDRGITQLLIGKGIEASLIPHGSTDKPAEEVVAILKDHEDVLEGLFDFVKRRRLLSTSYIKEIHQAFTRNQFAVQAVNGSGHRFDVELQRGTWKILPNNPTRPDNTIHEYCPPEHVSSEMDKLITFHHQHEEEHVPVEIESAWLHHRFTQIHPFQDGNGRVARALASLIFLRSGWFPLIIHRDIRTEYIQALESADNCNLKPLVDLFSSVQKKSFLRALKISEDVLRSHEPLQQVMAAAIERLKARFETQREKQRIVFDISKRIEVVTWRKVDSVAKEINDNLRKLNSEYGATVDQSDPFKNFWFKKQIIEIAKEADYFSDTRTYAAWIRLKIKEERQSELVISFHSLGVEFLGIMAASAFLEFRDRSEEGEVTVEGPYALSKDVFQFSFNEDADKVEARYKDWLSNVLLSGLDQWRRQI